MRIYPINQAKLVPEDLVFRQSRLWAAFAMALCGLLLGVGIYLLFIPRTGWIPWVMVIGGTLVTLPLLRNMLTAFSRDNWVLRLYGQRILLKIGPPCSGDRARVFVAEFQSKEFAWVGSHQRVTTTIEGGETTQRSSTCLELKPREGDMEALRSYIAAARMPVASKWSAKSLPVSVTTTSPTYLPVSLTSDGVLRVEWTGQYIMMAPSLQRALRLLASDIPARPKETERNDLTRSDADKKEMEKEIVALVEQGEIVRATQLARVRYGYSLTKAREFVAELAGGSGHAPG